MLDAVLVPLEHLMTSWWIYPALFALCAVDAFIPVFPSEAPLILAGVYAASGPDGPSLVLVVLAAMLGAALGACVGYLQGGLVGRALRRALVRFEERVDRTPAASLVLGVVLGALFALGLMALRRADRTTRIAFGPWMIVGAVFGMFAA